nr:patatin-like phospholipase family protein [uncultured Desulfobulbus sp.]
MAQKKQHGSTEEQKNAYFSGSSKDIDYFGATGIIDEEFKDILRRRKQEKYELPDVHRVEDLCGLALSGGGIRSASFSLGVMQALAYNRWLKEFDYLSSVSGGGYIGCGLSWTINQDPTNFGLSADTFPYASFPMSGEPRSITERQSLEAAVDQRNETNRWSGRLLHFLRQNANYLIPGCGLNFCTLIWVALRGVSMGLFVYGGLLALFFLLASKLHLLDQINVLNQLPYIMRANSFVVIAEVGLALCLLTIPLYSLFPYILYKRQVLSRGQHKSSYLFRRYYERASGWVLPCFLGLLLLGLIPSIHGYLVQQGQTSAEEITLSATLALSREGDASKAVSFEAKASGLKQTRTPEAGQKLWHELSREMRALFTGILAALIGLSAGVAILMKGIRSASVKIPLQPLVIVGVSALLFAILLVAYTVARAVLTVASDASLFWFMGGGGILVFVIALGANINLVSIHRYYRDRLMETFMPNVAEVIQGHYDERVHSVGADTMGLKDLRHGMYHIINTNVILAHAKKPKYKSRGGDNFILSARYCGSNATGWQSTDNFMQGGMTLATAMAISGAAINPSAGCGGEGVTRLTALSILMGLLNFRLGYWVPNPRYHNHSWRGKLRNPNFIYPGLYEVVLRSWLNEDRSYIQLSDGGHFENLGLYELIRRRLRVIVLCDAGADAKYSFSDLANAMQKIRTDFGAMIMIENEDLAPLIPQENPEKGEVACAQQGHLIATIKYADNSTGTLIYLTTTFFNGLSADLYGYKKAHPSFPDESTSDQFFDEKQFEAYRELGFQTAWKMMNCVEQDARLYKQVWPAGVAGA